MSDQGRVKYNKLIEYSRILAIFIAIFYHVKCLSNQATGLLDIFLKLAERGWIVTDFFLVISGYYFCNSYFKHCKTNPRLIFQRRLKRIVPHYYLFLAAYFLIGLDVLRLSGNNFSAGPNYWAYLFCFVANIPMAFGQWSGIALEGFFSINILVQLNLLFIVLFKIFKKDSSRLWVITFFILFSVLLRSLPFFRDYAWRSYFFTFTRLDGFLFGCLLYFLRNHKKTKEILIKYRILIFTLSFALLVAGVFFSSGYRISQTFRFPLGLSAIVLFFTAVLNLFLSIKKYNYSAFYSGNFVYSLYIVKLPLIYFVLGIFKMLFGDSDSSKNSILFLVFSFSACLLWGVLVVMGRRGWVKGLSLIRQ